MNRPFSLACAALLLAACSGGPDFESTIVATHSALVPGPGGPGISGPPLGRARGAVEVALSHDFNNTGAATREGGGLAHVHVGTRGAARVYFNAGRGVELGPSFEWSFGDGTPAAPDTPLDLGPNWFRGGLNLRVHLVRDRPWTLGLSADVLFSRIVYRTVRRSTTTEYAFTNCGSIFPCTQRDPAHDTVIDRASVDAAGAHYRGDFRLGVFGGGRVGGRLWILGGFVTQSHPLYAGRTVDTITCEARDECVDLSRYDAPSGAVVLGSFWAGVGVDAGAFAVFLRAQTSPLGSPALLERSPIGLTLSTRLHF